MNLKNILFLCSDNSCISQMAEGLAKNYYRGRYSINSAGLTSATVRGPAVSVMDEIGIDISSQVSKGLESFSPDQIDAVISLNEEAATAAKDLPAEIRKIHKDFENPLENLDVRLSTEELLNEYRNVRDELKEFIEMRLDTLV